MMKSMSWDQIARKYKDEWVLVEYDELDDDLQVIRGRVLAHSRSRDEVYSALLHATSDRIALEYLGHPTKDLVVLI
jgi:hypothetical protein